MPAAHVSLHDSHRRFWRGGMAVPPGRELVPGYTVIAHLSRGETVDAYEVWSTERVCGCVARALRDEHAGRERPRRRLQREGELLASLTHPHIVRGYEVVDAPRVVLVVEKLHGETLEQLIAGRRRPPVDEVRRLGVQLCSALGYLHRHGRLHLDLRPSNVVSEGGRAKISDLSHARAPGPAPVCVGARAARSPEHARGEAVSVASDVWALGAVLHELLTGRRRVPRALAEVVDACGDPVPEGRPALYEVLDALEPD